MTDQAAESKTPDYVVQIKEAAEVRDWPRFHQLRALEFERRQRDKDWPADRCELCRKRGMGNIGGPACCKSYNHHHLDFCLHCGDDERSPREWRFR